MKHPRLHSLAPSAAPPRQSEAPQERSDNPQGKRAQRAALGTRLREFFPIPRAARRTREPGRGPRR